MINSAKEAREIIAHDKIYGHKDWHLNAQEIKNRLDLKNFDWLSVACMAKGYLAALDGPEVRGLVETLEAIKASWRPCEGWMCSCTAEGALLLYREMVKP